MPYWTPCGGHHQLELVDGQQRLTTLCILADSPTDERFREEFASTSFKANEIDRARVCLERFEQQRQGEYVELIVTGADLVHVEHILNEKRLPTLLSQTRSPTRYRLNIPSFVLIRWKNDPRHRPNLRSIFGRFLSR